MNRIRLAAAAAAALSVAAGGVFAAAAQPAPAAPAAVPVVPVAPATCMSIVDFFASPCQVAAYGVRFYGTLDMGFSYMTHPTPLDPLPGPGVGQFPVKNSGVRGAGFTLSPNALSFSNIGVQVAEPLGAGWRFVGQLEAGFLPTSLELGDNAGSVHENAGLTLAQQRLGADGSGNGQFYNLLGFAGFSHDTWGTLTFGRQNNLGKDMVFAYDPMGNAFAFSYIGFFGATAGGGDTENAKTTTALKYRVNIANWRLGAIVQLGGYDQGNASQGMWQASAGGDLHLGPGIFSFDVMGGFTENAVSQALAGGVNAEGVGLTNVPQSLAVTLSNNTNFMATAKYVVDRLKLYAGYEWIQFAPPSDRVTSLTDESGNFLCNSASFGGSPACLVGGLPTAINVANFDFGKKVQQTVWTGFRYSFTPQLDLAGAYYHADFSAFGAAPSAGNGFIAGAVPEVCAVNPRASGNCHGTADSVSFLLDWQFAAKWDTYIGTQYTKLNGSQANGFFVDNNWSTTAGIRFRW